MLRPLPTSGELFAQSWKLMKQEWKATLKWTLGLTLFSYVVTILNVWFTYAPEHKNPFSWLSFFFSIVTLLGTLFFTNGLMKHLSEKSAPEITTRPTFWNAYGRGLIVAILTLPLVIAGFVFLIVPGIWIGVALGFAMMFVIENGRGSTDAMAASFNLVKGRWWKVLGRNLFIGSFILGINLAFALVLFILIILLGFAGLHFALPTGGMTTQALADYFSVPGHAALLLGGSGILFLVVLVLSTILKAFSFLIASAWHVEFFHALKETADQPAK